MSVQLVLLKSGEEIVTDLREIVDRDTGEMINLVFIKPVRVTLVQQGVLAEGTQPGESVLSFVPWLTTTKNEEYFMKEDWIVTICDPTDDIRESYIKNIGVRDDSENLALKTGQFLISKLMSDLMRRLIVFSSTPNEFLGLHQSGNLRILFP